MDLDYRNYAATCKSNSKSSLVLVPTASLVFLEFLDANSSFISVNARNGAATVREHVWTKLKEFRKQETNKCGVTAR